MAAWGATTMSPIGAPANGARPRRPAVAFTLIELILVMALLVIVIATVAPSLSHFFHGRNLDAEARRFLSLTRFGQSRAISEGVPMRLWIDVNRHTYGLQGEYGGSTMDNSSRVYPLDPELLISVERNNRITSSRRVATVNTGVATDGSSLAVGIRFLADGSLDETSPEQIRIYEDPTRRPDTSSSRRGDNEVWITTDLNRLRYEISTNRFGLVRR